VWAAEVSPWVRDLGDLSAARRAVLAVSGIGHFEFLGLLVRWG
jgi:hypothetical protein